MTMREYYDLCEYWADRPPEHESLAMLLDAQTDWEPKSRQVLSVEDHRASLERRWKAGAMNIKQMWEATGGVLSMNAQGSGGKPLLTGPGMKPIPMGGIGPFPGA
jgi:hypothetical protein